jgi:hypothetical protein
LRAWLDQKDTTSLFALTPHSSTKLARFLRPTLELNSSAKAALLPFFLHNVSCKVPNSRSYESQSLNPTLPPRYSLLTTHADAMPHLQHSLQPSKLASGQQDPTPAPKRLRPCIILPSTFSRNTRNEEGVSRLGSLR